MNATMRVHSPPSAAALLLLMAALVATPGAEECPTSAPAEEPAVATSPAAPVTPTPETVVAPPPVIRETGDSTGIFQVAGDDGRDDGNSRPRQRTADDQLRAASERQVAMESARTTLATSDYPILGPEVPCQTPRAAEIGDQIRRVGALIRSQQRARTVSDPPPVPPHDVCGGGPPPTPEPTPWPHFGDYYTDTWFDWSHQWTSRPNLTLNYGIRYDLLEDVGTMGPPSAEPPSEPPLTAFPPPDSERFPPRVGVTVPVTNRRRP